MKMMMLTIVGAVVVVCPSLLVSPVMNFFVTTDFKSDEEETKFVGRIWRPEAQK
jgi:hypothetical protein